VGRGRGTFLPDRKQFASHQPTHSRLRGTFGDPNGFRQLAIAHLNRFVALLLFFRKPQVDKEADGPAIMSDQVAH